MDPLEVVKGGSLCTDPLLGGVGVGLKKVVNTVANYKPVNYRLASSFLLKTNQKARLS
jgi:hypothetical protein